MIRAKARYRDSKLELDQPLDLQEGAEVELQILTATEIDAAEKEGWLRLAEESLAKVWNNSDDALYDNWKKLYGVDGR